MVNLLSERDIHVSLNWLTHRCHSNVVTCFNRKFRRCYCDNSNFDSSVGRGMGGGGGPSKEEVRKSFHNQFYQQVYMLLSVLLLEFDLRERIRLLLV